MFVCELDALRDSELMFGLKFLNADKESGADRLKILYMKEYPHGFCGHLRKGTEEGEKGCILTCDMFRDMFL
jgi:hypothetical protein